MKNPGYVFAHLCATLKRLKIKVKTQAISRSVRFPLHVYSKNIDNDWEFPLLNQASKCNNNFQNFIIVRCFLVHKETSIESSTAHEQNTVEQRQVFMPLFRRTNGTYWTNELVKKGRFFVSAMTIGEIGFEGYVTTRHSCQVIAIRESCLTLPKIVTTLKFRLVLFMPRTLLASYQNNTNSYGSTKFNVNGEIAFLLPCCFLGFVRGTFINGAYVQTINVASCVGDDDIAIHHLRKFFEVYKQ